MEIKFLFKNKVTSQKVYETFFFLFFHFDLYPLNNHFSFTEIVKLLCAMYENNAQIIFSSDSVPIR